MSDCHYGCYLGRKCLGISREDLIEFLRESEPGPDYGSMSDDQLDQALDLYNERHSDEYYAGPDHMKRAL